MQSVRLFRVFIASPFDVIEERNAACQVILEWNAANTLSRSIMIEPVRIETHIHAMQGGHPQDLINAQLLEQCDFLVAIFSSRVGTPTNSDPSGAIQEFREFGEKKGKDRIMLFFSDKDIPSTADLSQVQAVRDFKDSVKGQGIHIKYTSVEEFSRLFRQQLDHAMNKVETNSRKPPETEPKYEKAIFTPEANTLLAAAAIEERGTISMSRSRAGEEVCIGSICYSRGNDPRSESRWAEGLNQLVQVGYVKDRGFKGEVFGLTNKWVSRSR